MKSYSFYLSNFNTFWDEIELRAKNNYGPFGTGEEVEININKAIQELADEMKQSQKSVEIKHSILIDNNLG